jgi:hypothetical protein
MVSFFVGRRHISSAEEMPSRGRGNFRVATRKLSVTENDSRTMFSEDLSEPQSTQVGKEVILKPCNLRCMVSFFVGRRHISSAEEMPSRGRGNSRAAASELFVTKDHTREMLGKNLPQPQPSQTRSSPGEEEKEGRERPPMRTVFYFVSWYACTVHHVAAVSSRKVGAGEV